MPNIPGELAKRIREAFKLGNYTLREHGFERMIERGIHPQSVRRVVLEGDAIEHDPAGTKGADESLLFNGLSTEFTPLHVKVAERTTRKGYRHFVVTVYEPDPKLWQDGYSRRR